MMDTVHWSVSSPAKEDAMQMKMNTRVGITQPDRWKTLGITRMPGPQTMLRIRTADPSSDIVLGLHKRKFQRKTGEECLLQIRCGIRYPVFVE